MKNCNAINLFQKKILHFCSSGLTLIFKTAGRKTVSLVVVEPVHALAIVAEEPVPRVSSIVLRRRPEEGVVREIAENAGAGKIVIVNSNNANYTRLGLTTL